MAEVALFVYGTLRVGQGNYGLLAGAPNRVITDVRVPGKMYYAGYDYGGHVEQAPYPCVRFTEGEDGSTVLGDILFIEEMHPALRSAHRMELGAGYVIAEFPVETPDGTIMALGYHWPDDDPTGDRIEDGDFVAARRGRMHA